MGERGKRLKRLIRRVRWKLKLERWKVAVADENVLVKREREREREKGAARDNESM